MSDENLSPSLVRAVREAGRWNGGPRGRVPTRDVLHRCLDLLLEAFFPGFWGGGPVVPAELVDFVDERLHQARRLLLGQASLALESCGQDPSSAAGAVDGLLGEMGTLRVTLEEDLEAAFRGDPAARSIEEILLAYPCVDAIATYRLAHELHVRGIPLIPRVWTERAHSRTGADIHPGATIGRGFFIDHCTGVVIGETCTIGTGVKLYQGVTLGALSHKRDGDGNLIKGLKRHPTVGDRVTIYAGATVLGGATVIGDDSVVGGNVWLTHSVPAGAKVLQPEIAPHIQCPVRA